MTFWFIFIAAQAVVMLFALVRESGSDERFEGAKLEYRS